MKARTAIKSIRKFCVDVCCCGSEYEVRECLQYKEVKGVEACPLYPYRMGKNPNVSEETKAKQRERLVERGGFSGSAQNTGD